VLQHEQRHLHSSSAAAKLQHLQKLLLAQSEFILDKRSLGVGIKAGNVI
jgi:hypothetical protein